MPVFFVSGELDAVGLDVEELAPGHAEEVGGLLWGEALPAPSIADGPAESLARSRRVQILHIFGHGYLRKMVMTPATSLISSTSYGVKKALLDPCLYWVVPSNLVSVPTWVISR